MIISYGSSSLELAKSVGALAKMRVVGTNCRRFPDGEQFVKVEGDVQGEDVALIHTTALNPDTLLMEYALITDALKGAGCRTVTGVIPYLAYARQDSRFHTGESLSSKVYSKLIEDAGTDRIITIDTHLHRIKKIEDFFSVPAVNLSAMPVLGEYYMKNFGNEKTLVIGPDLESEQWARVVADKLGSNCTIFEKERKGDREVAVKGGFPTGPYAGSRVVLVDDIVSTGRTLIEVISGLRAQGASRVDALVTHSLLVEDALLKMKNAGLDALISTDTVPGPHATVSVAPVIAEALINFDSLYV